MIIKYQEAILTREKVILHLYKHHMHTLLCVACLKSIEMGIAS